jgi:hypothetical protein
MDDRGQGAGEYVVVLALVAALVAAIALSGFREQELNLAVAAARSAAQEYTATQNASLVLTGLEYEATAANTTFRPRYYVHGSTLVTNATTLPGLQYAVLDRVRRTLRPNSALSTGQSCVQAATTVYCCCG